MASTELIPTKHESPIVPEPESNDSLHMRHATPTDLELLVDYYEQAAIGSTGTGFDAKEREETRVAFGYMLDDENYGAEVLEDEDGPVAAILFEYNSPAIKVDGFEALGESPQEIDAQTAIDLACDLDPDIKRVHVTSLAVDEDKRGMGLGIQLMEKFEQEQAGKTDVITFQTGKDNKAMIRLAEKCGFTLIDVKDDTMKGYDGEYLVAVKVIGELADRLHQQKEDNLRELLKDVEGL
ncbi:GNAT family N-acetyltransferase [candidate division WWE3 bacterium]|uniref:GNAT family N-acetyltransferase n=1 Tax=candidate division WWE3 bacterium TaxID=2053526 RepID=A0A955LLA2_UNCKA|nr:GNAT family N-acetyltransferase [candidate division WWE3 bacterium]